MNDRNAIDAVVIGAGIAGASVAYFMSNHAKVVVLERESHPGVHSTGRSAALFSESYGNEQIRALTRASRAFLERPPRGFAENALLSPRGALVTGTREHPWIVATPESLRERLTELVEDGAYRRAKRREARAYMERHWSPAAIAGRFEAIYGEALERGSVVNRQP